MSAAGAGRIQALEAEPRRTRDLETPEGVMLKVVLPEHGTRAAAFAIDAAFWALGSAAVALLSLVSALDILSSGLLLPLLVLAAGLVRNFYFLFFELAWQGQTPGKRLTRIRVIDNRGGALRPRAIVARNLTRELELAVPASMVLMPGATTGLGDVLILLWLCLFFGFPLLNRDRMRCGDLIAGTWVIELPPLSLGQDLAATTPTARPRHVLPGGARERQAPTETAGLSFTEAQLARYEQVHLRVLEEVLRRPDDPRTRELRAQIARNIAAKIGYEAPVPPARTAEFLTAFYSQFRNRLERDRLYRGVPKTD